ncbi:MAG: hypothetical protein HOJ29_03315, partial [Candidatus Magasanikbacteria bacterium]|nr:hypothetical protein [Candidatus Magasanikbacteria bacterium]
FSFERSRYIDITLPFEARLSLSPRISGVLSRIVEYIPVLRRFGHLLLVRLKKVSTVSADVSSISGRVLYRKRLSSGFFQKCWIWFSTPFDIPGASLINAFSYTKADVSGFRCKEGLTSIVDLTLDETILWENCRKSFIRKQITRGERAGIEIRQCTDFSEFKKIYTAFRKAKSLPLDDVYMFTEGVLFGAYYKGEMIAANIYITEAPFTRLWVAASKRLDGSSSREVVGWANRMLIWESMKWFKKYGYTHFDLGGFSSDSTDKKEQSLAEFKESYGGERTPCFYYHKVNSSLLRRWMRFRGYAV